MASTTVLSPKRLVTPVTSMARSFSSAAMQVLFREGDVDGLAGVEVAGGGGVVENRFDHEDEFGAVLAVVEDGRGVFRLRREVTDAGSEGRGPAVNINAHGGTGGEARELSLGNKKTNFDVFRRKERDDGITGGDEFSGAIKGVVNQSVARSGLGFLRDSPIGFFFGRARGADLGFGGRQCIGAAAELSGGQLGGEFFDRAGVALVHEAGAVVIGLGDDAGVVEIFLAGEIELGELGGGAGLVEPGFEGGELGGT